MKVDVFTFGGRSCTRLLANVRQVSRCFTGLEVVERNIIFPEEDDIRLMKKMNITDLPAVVIGEKVLLTEKPSADKIYKAIESFC